MSQQKKLYDPAMAEHLAYVQSQRHTRGDLQRAVNGFNGRPQKQTLRGDVMASRDIRPQGSFSNPTVDTKRYMSTEKGIYGFGTPRCRVMKP